MGSLIGLPHSRSCTSMTAALRPQTIGLVSAGHAKLDASFGGSSNPAAAKTAESRLRERTMTRVFIVGVAGAAFLAVGCGGSVSSQSTNQAAATAAPAAATTPSVTLATPTTAPPTAAPMSSDQSWTALVEQLLPRYGQDWAAMAAPINVNGDLLGVVVHDSAGPYSGAAVDIYKEGTNDAWIDLASITAPDALRPGDAGSTPITSAYLTGSASPAFLIPLVAVQDGSPTAAVLSNFPSSLSAQGADAEWFMVPFNLLATTLPDALCAAPQVFGDALVCHQGSPDEQTWAFRPTTDVIDGGWFTLDTQPDAASCRVEHANDGNSWTLGSKGYCVPVA